MSRPKINRIKLNRRDINIRQVYVTIRHIASESDENYKEISIMVLIFVDKDSNMNMTKGALILSLSFLLAACSSIPQNIKPRFYVSTSKSIIKALINMHSFEIQLSPIG
ncbi:hypothetical protein F7O57_24090 [Escherichia coli]|nr:hypothetical protein F7O57_24090 [Escherichia coli]